MQNMYQRAPDYKTRAMIQKSGLNVTRSPIWALPVEESWIFREGGKASISQLSLPQLYANDTEHKEDQKRQKKDIAEHWKRVKKECHQDPNTFKIRAKLNFITLTKYGSYREALGRLLSSLSKIFSFLSSNTGSVDPELKTNGWHIYLTGPCSRGARLPQATDFCL